MICLHTAVLPLTLQHNPHPRDAAVWRPRIHLNVPVRDSYPLFSLPVAGWLTFRLQGSSAAAAPGSPCGAERLVWFLDVWWRVAAIMWWGDWSADSAQQAMEKIYDCVECPPTNINYGINAEVNIWSLIFGLIIISGSVKSWFVMSKNLSVSVGEAPDSRLSSCFL